jgi:hypothetical protein
MGGRGNTAPISQVDYAVDERVINLNADWEDVGSVNYNVIPHTAALGGAEYPFLEATGRAWNIVTWNIDEPPQLHPAHTFEQDSPTLRWVNGGSVVDVYVDGMSTEEYLQSSGLELDMRKGGYVLSKRLSRIMRPHFVSGMFPADDITVRYMDELGPEGEKVWDGAGVISRRMLERMVLSQDLTEAKREQLLREMKHAHRVEFTVMSDDGQDKGHAIVSDDLDVDFLMRRDTKKEVRLTNGQKFVGIGFVHGHDDMRLDIQSLINLHPFFEEGELGEWLDEEGKLFIESIETGKVAEAMSRIDRHATLEEVQEWPLREYLASGGSPMWFSSHVKALANQHLQRLNQSTLEKLRLPIPGGRYYVMPIGVGRAAGMDHEVPCGGIHLDKQYGTAWVNDEDWVQLEGSTEGIASILGGADNDDALWVHPFTDYDGEHRVLAWRSPNQLGEYVILHPTEGSHDLTWETRDGIVSYPQADTRKLMPRIDRMQVNYLNLVDEATAGGLGEGQPYSIEVMDATMQRAQANAGALGMYCNSLMVNKAVYGTLPAKPPAPLEQVIDGSVKTGVDLSPVVGWAYENSAEILAEGQPIPAVLHGRLSRSQDSPFPRASHDHWLDRTLTDIRSHITEVEGERDRLAASAMPPRAVFDSAFDNPETIKLGGGLNQTYARSLKRALREKGRLSDEDYDRARSETEAYLEQFPAEQQTAVLRGAMVSAYMGDMPESDAAIWLPGEKTETGRKLGIANKSIQALREIGVLDEIAQTSSGLVSYPGASIQEPTYKTIGINGVWFNWYKRWAEENGESVPQSMSDVPKDRAKWAKHIVQTVIQPDTMNIRMSVVTSGDRKLACDEEGNLVGYLSKDSQDLVEGTYNIKASIVKDGNLRTVVYQEMSSPK